MKWLPGGHQQIFTLTKEMVNFVQVKINEHRESLDPSPPRDYIDCFLKEMGDVSGFIFVCIEFVLFAFSKKIRSLIPETCLVLLIERG